MRNLSLLRNISIKYPFLESLKKCLIFSESSTSKSTKLFVFNKFIELYQLNIKDDFSFEEIFILDLFQFIDDPSQTVTVAGFNSVFNELYVILSHGYLISVVITGDDEDNEALGQSLNVGATKVASWSPDFERTVLINSEDKLFIFNIVNTDAEKLNEISLQNVAEEENKFINVGWGKVETQFRGSEGKFSKSSLKEAAVIDEDVTDTSVHVCWKSNATAFAVSYICYAEKNRKIKVFSQDGTLLNVTKDISGLHSPADWSPSRNIIFCPQTLPNKQVICCIEQNGLRHGDFEIPKETKVKELLWNSNGSILACYGTVDDRELITLWTTSNYKWYMKQNLQFDESIIYVQWDFLSPNRLHVILQSGVYRSYEWSLQVNESSKNGSEANKAIVAVVNGQKLGVTPYALVNHPPSMPYKSYDLSPHYVNAVIFPETISAAVGDFDCNSMLLYMSNNSFSVLKFDDKIGSNLQLNFENGPVQCSTPSELAAFTWILPNYLFFSWCRIDGHYFCVSRLDNGSQTIILEKTFSVDSPILSTCSYHTDVIVHVDNGKLFLYRDGKLQSMEISFVEPCVRLQILNEDTFIALSENRNLYVNETIKYRDVVSFFWKPPFVIMLTMDSQLLISKVTLSGRETSFDEVLSRGVEPKSYLITIVDDRVLMETERGNLETIVPRPFSIFQMEEKLKSSQYFEAFKMLRKQRINLNVLFDHDPDEFLKNIKTIIGDVSDSTCLLNFITELEDDNVAASMFPWKYHSNFKIVPNKVETICQHFCSAIKELDNPKLIVPLIAALVKQNKLTDAAKYAVEYNEVQTLSHLCDPLAVYKAALGSFDLVHALHIIQHSKLDPSEYLPFIHELQTLEENYQKFKICNYLENFSAALTHLAQCDGDDKFEECVEYVKKHQLFRTAVEIFHARSCESEVLRNRYVQILTIAAENYEEKQCLLDAGILFERAAVYHRALSCYLSIGDWSSAISISKYMHSDKESLVQTSKVAYDVLFRQRKFEDAGFVAYHFISDCKLAIDAYLIARKFCCAINAARGLKSDEAILQSIRPTLIEETKSLISQQKSKLATLEGYRDRLHVVREMKKHPERENNEDDRQSVISSDGSDSSSILSCSSKASSASSSAKRARRRERRLWNLKPGNRREEPSLLNAIRQAVIQYEKEYHELVPDLIKALVRTDEFVLARELETYYQEFLASIKRIVERTWSEANVPEDGAGFQDILILCPPDVASFKNDLVLITSK
ncbi:hypothetical protein V9T40_009311 [Parthenolecanium corni]|uniref:Elongator complex protein 1 n=1 Tax=Parthenolecanium corni TaxID=536013 RepID=A0AAN9TS98_9HEMI